MGIVIIRKPPAETQAFTLVPSEESDGFLIQDEAGSTIGTAIDEIAGQAYVDMLNAGG